MMCPAIVLHNNINGQNIDTQVFNLLTNYVQPKRNIFTNRHKTTTTTTTTVTGIHI